MAVRKLYCYIDESGQNTKGKTFVVSVVVMKEQRDVLLAICEQLEVVSGKRKDKWGEAKHEDRMRYIRHIFADNRFKGLLRYEIFRETTDYDSATIEGIVNCVTWKRPNEQFTTLIYVDGLQKTKRHEYGSRLRRFGLPVRKIQGISRDETNGLIRLADTLAGFVLDALEGKSKEIALLFKKAKRDKFLIEVS